jgi:hypothetical protein
MKCQSFPFFGVLFALALNSLHAEPKVYFMHIGGEAPGTDLSFTMPCIGG